MKALKTLNSPLAAAKNTNSRSSERQDLMNVQKPPSKKMGAGPQPGRLGRRNRKSTSLLRLILNKQVDFSLNFQF
jgi:hypothetical protein